MTELHFASAVDLVDKIKARKISAFELLEHFLDRVERHNPALNAIIWLDKDGAQARARAADAALDRGEDWGPLHGLPMTVKESYDLAGSPTTWGDPALKDNVRDSNAVVVERLLGAGANIFGKTNVPLDLADWQSFNDVYGTTNNPWDLTRTPGGSSGGSAAALAAGLTGLEAGSDIGASIRNPRIIAAFLATNRPMASCPPVVRPDPAFWRRRISPWSGRWRAAPRIWNWNWISSPVRTALIPPPGASNCRNRARPN